MEDAARCETCAIRREVEDLYYIIISLSSYCRDRVEAATYFVRKYERKFATRFFHWVASKTTGKNYFIEYHTQLSDCQQWVDVVLQTLTMLLLSAVSRAISNNKIISDQALPQGILEVKCWAHLPNIFTNQNVKEGWAKMKCMADLEEKIQETKVQHLSREKNKEKMERDGVELSVLEHLVSRIIRDGSPPSSTESLPSTPSPTPIPLLQHRRQASHLQRGASDDRERSYVIDVATLRVTTNRDKADHDERSHPPTQGELSQHAPTLSGIQTSRLHPNVQSRKIIARAQISERRPEDQDQRRLSEARSLRPVSSCQPKSTASSVWRTDNFSEENEDGFRAQQPIKKSQSSGHHVNGQSRIVDLRARDHEQLARQEDRIILKDGRWKQIQRESRATNVFPEGTQTQHRRPVLSTKHAFRPSRYDPEDERIEDRAATTNFSGPIGHIARLPIGQAQGSAAHNRLPSPQAGVKKHGISSQRSYTIGNGVRSDNKRYTPHNREEQHRTREMVHERSPGSIRASTASDSTRKGAKEYKPSTSNYRQERSGTRQMAYSSDHESSTAMKPETQVGAIYPNEMTPPPRVNLNKDKRHLQVSRNENVPGPRNYRLPPRQGQDPNIGVPIRMQCRASASSVDVSGGAILVPPGLDINVQNHQPIPRYSKTDDERTSQSSSRRPSLSGYDSAIGMARSVDESSELLGESPARRRRRRRSTQYPPSAFKYNEERRGRGSMSSDSNDSGIGMSSDGESHM